MNFAGRSFSETAGQSGTLLSAFDAPRPIHIVDSNQATRSELARLVGAQGWATQLYTAGEQLLSVAPQLDKGCAVVDMRLPRMDGLTLLDALRSVGVFIPVILVAAYANVALAVEAVKRGATDVIERPYLPDIMLSSIRLALSAPEETSLSQQRSPPDRRLPRLTRRESEVLKAMVRGKPTKEIARDLSLSPRTIEVYRANVMAKTGAEHLADLVRLVMSVTADPAVWGR